MAAAKPKQASKPSGKAGGRWDLYETSGGLKRKTKFCPKCGEGTFMAKHKNRYSCGKCHYTEFVKQEQK